jgi:hypothetical protein
MIDLAHQKLNLLLVGFVVDHILSNANKQTSSVTSDHEGRGNKAPEAFAAIFRVDHQFGTSRLRLVHRSPVRLNATATQAIGPAIHELSTNAGKYGALSVDAGRVDVCWRLGGNVFTMSWTEFNGPRVSPPERCGFGGTVITSMVRGSGSGPLCWWLSAARGLQPRPLYITLPTETLGTSLCVFWF